MRYDRSMPGIALATDRREQLIDVTESVAAAVAELGVADGAVLLHVPHTTAAVTINEGFDPDVAADVVDVLARLVPRDDGYAHLEGNSDSHAKSIMVGCSQLLGVAGGTPVLGRWQRIFFCEFDGPRQRQLLVLRV
jgi:secondary thiamine-phosphate synthase enzyme